MAEKKYGIGFCSSNGNYQSIEVTALYDIDELIDSLESAKEYFTGEKDIHHLYVIFNEGGKFCSTIRADEFKMQDSSTIFLYKGKVIASVPSSWMFVRRDKCHD